MQTKIIQHCQCQVAEVSLVQSVLSPVSGFVIVRDIFTAQGIVSNCNKICVQFPVSESVFTVPCLSVG